jgi:hypothetical protein
MGYAESLLANGERIVVHERRHWLAVPLDSKWAILALVVAIALVVLNLDGTVSGSKGVIGTGLGWLILILVVGAIAWIAWTIWNWINEDYLVTNRRVLRVEGVINKHATDSSLEKINDAALDQHFIGRIFGYGDLDILTANETSGDRFKMLAHVVAFKREMLNQKNELEFEQMRPAVTPPLRAGTSTSASTPPPPEPMPAPSSQSPMSATGDLMTGTADAGGPNGATVTIDPVPRPAPVPSGAPSMSPAEVTATLASLADLRDRGAITPEEYEAKKADLLERL